MTTIKQKTRPSQIVLWLFIAFFIICFCTIFGTTIKRGSPPTPTQISTPTQTIQPTKTPIPTATINQAVAKSTKTLTPAPTDTPVPTATFDPHAEIKTQIETILGEGNRDIPRVSAINFDDPEHGAIFINWAIDDNFSADWISSAARRDATEMLKAIHNSGLDYTYVILSGSFLMVDKYGNTSEDNVFNLTFNKATVEKINWENFRSDDIDNIADEAFIHQDFRDSE